MGEKELAENCNKKHVRQPPSVPFLWEEKPGTPKKDWKPETTSVSSAPTPPPVKLVASVPFKWEEKPGIPLPYFSQSPLQPVPLAPPAKLIGPLLPVYSQGYDNDGSDSDDEQERISELDLESFGFGTDKSFSSVSSLLANCLISSVAISTAIPVQKTSSITSSISYQLETPFSPASETDSSTSSYATGTSSLVGNSFLECLFPLLPPNSGFLDKVGHSEKGFVTPPELKSFDTESNNSVMVKRPPTLGELIMMSRRRSYRRKAVQMRKQNLSMRFMKKRAFGCCIFGTSSKMIEGLQRKMKHQPSLKLL